MSTPQMQTTAEQNKQIMVRWFEEIWNQGKRETIHELFAEQGILHDGSATFHGPDEFCRFYDAFQANFTDFRAEPLISLAERDLACLHRSISFRHKASNKPLHVTGTSVVRFPKRSADRRLAKLGCREPRPPAPRIFGSRYLASPPPQTRAPITVASRTPKHYV